MKAMARTLIVCLGVLVQGCSLAILGEDIEATDLSLLAIGTPRENVENILGAPISEFPEKQGIVSIYAYDRGAKGQAMLDARGYLECWGLLNIFCEPIMTPIAIVKRQERYEAQQGQVGIHFGAGDALMVAVTAGHGMKPDHWNALARGICGDPEAQFRVGEAFETGRGPRVDHSEALRWYSNSALGGYPWAGERKKSLAANMAREDIERAEILVATWDPVLEGCKAVTAPESGVYRRPAPTQETSN